MLKFTGQPQHEALNISIPYRALQDEALSVALIDAIKALTTVVGGARCKDISEEFEPARWAKEFLIGFALLAIGEARSILLLLSDSLNRHARVHLRSLYEYELRARLLLDEPDKAIAFRDSTAYEMRQIGKRLDGSMEQLEKEIAATLGVADARNIVGEKESAAFGGSVRDQMKDEVAPEQRYVGTFAWASLVSHGSILALRELSRAVHDAGDDLLSRAAADDKATSLLYHSCWLILWFAQKISAEFGVAVPELGGIAANLVKINRRLQIVSQEIEAAAIHAIEQHRKKRQTRQ